MGYKNSEITKAKIKMSAIRLMNKIGATASGLRGIAKETGIAYGNLCYHYPGVDGLFGEIVSDFIDEVSSKGLLAKTKRKYKFFFQEPVHVLRISPTGRQKFTAWINGSGSQYREEFFRLVIQHAESFVDN